MADDAIGIAELSATGTPSGTTFLRGDNVWAAAQADIVTDTTPQLGGDLDVQTFAINTSTTNGDIDLDANGAGLIQVTEFNLSQVPIVTQHDIGTAANEIPLNGMLGGMAFQDPASVSVDDLNAAGLLLIGRTTSFVTESKFGVSGSAGASGCITEIHHDGNAGANRDFIRFLNQSGTEAGSIEHSGSTSVAFRTASDYRLKENIVPVTSAIERVVQLNPCRFNFISEPSRTVDGFIAHEVQSVVPESVGGEKDAVDDEGNPVYQGIDQSKLVPLLTAALQEALAKIETLETRLTALEGGSN